MLNFYNQICQKGEHLFKIGTSIFVYFSSEGYIQQKFPAKQNFFKIIFDLETEN